ncbi:hypothetical protein [Methylobacterium sp.]|uniref:hypothetical protein n=1 Tax=Methylobacterium sp. TaxID=409 RepID=UPI003B00C10E
MAIHHLTPPFGGGERPRLPSAQVGPVTRALRACRPINPADLAIADIQIGLASFFADADRQRVRELRRRIADRIEADLALLDALAGDADLEDGHDAEGLTDDNGIADLAAIGEQGFPGYGRCL